MDLSFLEPLYQHPGPFASVYLDVSRDNADAVLLIDKRWRDARDKLRRAGAAADTIDALGATLAEFPPATGKRGLCLFGAGGNTILAETFPGPPAMTIATVGPLPDAMPLVAWRGERVPWLRVVVDRTGADLEGATHGEVDRRLDVEGHNEYPIHKSGQGGWSQPRYARWAELNWERNAAEIAEAVAAMAQSIGAEVIVVAGDSHVRPMLVEHLPRRWQHRVVLSEVGSRAPGADPEALDQVTLVAVAELAHRRTGEILDRFHSELGRDAAAGTGLAPVVTGLRRAQVDTVLLVNDRSSTEHLWIGPHATDLSPSADELRAAGVAEPQKVRADAALLRAIVGTQAELVLVTAHETRLQGGIGAVLRYADAATRHR